MAAASDGWAGMGWDWSDAVGIAGASMKEPIRTVGTGAVLCTGRRCSAPRRLLRNWPAGLPMWTHWRTE
ncbi:hypothetical protein [Streptomyces scabiei]|uniref:hypothetical protein n=1 Tax=Streptomyces scabiei TaxID=1930 RepID=UPI0038F7B47D